MDPDAPLIAKAISAFDHNNRVRLERGKAAIESKVMFGITMNLTRPTFYKIPVTTNLVNNVQLGTFPSEPTIVSFHVPVLPSPKAGTMKPLDNRQAHLRCFEAFKHIIGI